MNEDSMVTLADDREHGSVPTSLYVHIPFCKSRCFYCDFTTYVAPETVISQYLNDLDHEFAMISKEATVPLKTVFFGGGTPTMLKAAELEQLLESLHRHFRISTDAEITMEANPGSVNRDKLTALLNGGVNRLSFGAQTFSDRLLMTIGRLHEVSAIERSVRLAEAAGFTHMNLDLMFGLPEQSLEDVKEALTRVLELPVSHISAYWLKVEAGTPFGEWERQGKLPLPGEDAEADMYEVVRTVLREHGFHHYEISNFAKPHEEARHNLVYWRNQPYFAAGAGAHGYQFGERIENVTSLKEYTECIEKRVRPISTRHRVSVLESMEDAMMLGLRTYEGVSTSAFRTRYGVSLEDVFGELLKSLIGDGLLTKSGGIIRLAESVWPVANTVFEKFIGELTVD